MLSRSSDLAWKRWGEIDPYFAVLTKPEYRAGEILTHRDVFFGEGQAYIDELLALVGRASQNMVFGRALDFGCGVGRLVLPLARRFDEVVGIDISPAMLEEGRANAKSAELANASFVLSDDTLSSVEGSFNFVHSFIVLQHIPVQRGLSYMDRMLGLLSPNGTAAFHFTVDREQGIVRDAINWSRRTLPLANNLANLARGLKFGEPMMQMNEYPLLTVLKLYEQHGIINPLVMLDRQEATLAVKVIGQKA